MNKNYEIAEALEKCDWSNISIGNKFIIKAAIEALKKASSLQARINEAIWNEIWDKNNPERCIAPMDIVTALHNHGLVITEITKSS